jgi:excinuclease ABC subunit C
MLNIDNQDEEFLENFIVQNYFSKSKQSKSNNKNNNFDYFEPANIEILTSINLTNRLLLSKVIGSKISCAKAGDKLAWQKIAQNSAVEALATRVVEYRRQKNNFQQLTNLLGRSKPIERIACFDISHTTGKETIGACVVFNLFGKEKANFRLFNLNLEQKADDYQALQQTITRYLSNIIEKPHLAPELIMVDGGKGQLSIAEQVIASLQQELTKKKIFISLLAIAKGKDRKPGLEKIYLTASGDQLSLQSSSPVFKLLQTIRDAAHKFAISSHRRKRDRLAK